MTDERDLAAVRERLTVLFLAVASRTGAPRGERRGESGLLTYYPPESSTDEDNAPPMTNSVGSPVTRTRSINAMPTDGNSHPRSSMGKRVPPLGVTPPVCRGCHDRVWVALALPSKLEHLGAQVSAERPELDRGLFDGCSHGQNHTWNPQMKARVA